MSPVFGVVSQNTEEVTVQVKSMMDTIECRSPDDSWVWGNTSALGKNGRTEPVPSIALGQISFRTKNFPEQLVSDSNGNLKVVYDGKLYNMEELSSGLMSRHKKSSRNESETVAHLLEDRYDGDLSRAAKQVLSILDGDFFLAASDGAQTIIARDPAGLRPAFYAENGRFVAFASIKKALWKIGLRNVKPLRAGMLASIDENGVAIEDVSSLRQMGMEFEVNDGANAVDAYCDLAINAVRKRMRNSERVGVLMSGGVDSCLMAKLVADIAAEEGIEVIAYTAGVDGSSDIEYARRFAKQLHLRHKIRRIRAEEIGYYIPRVACVVEERDMVQIEAGIGIYASLDSASQDDIHQVFSGQGPDELWGGYSWYPKIIAAEGYKGLQRRMLHDLQRGDIETFDRENKIAFAHRSEQLFPYCDNEVVRLAMSVSPHLKIKSAEDRIGKHPHREAAVKLGVPREFAYREKDAAQHGTGVHATLDAISRRNGFTPELVNEVGYDSEEVCQDKLASSTRYGYRFAEHELWEVPAHVQFFLDSVAYRNGLLNESVRSVIGRFLEEANMQ